MVVSSVQGSTSTSGVLCFICLINFKLLCYPSIYKENQSSCPFARDLFKETILEVERERKFCPAPGWIQTRDPLFRVICFTTRGRGHKKCDHHQLFLLPGVFRTGTASFRNSQNDIEVKYCWDEICFGTSKTFAAKVFSENFTSLHFPSKEKNESWHCKFSGKQRR